LIVEKNKNNHKKLTQKSAENSVSITAQQLQLIIAGITLSSVKKRVRYEHHFVDKKSLIPIVSAVI